MLGFVLDAHDHSGQQRISDNDMVRILQVNNSFGTCLQLGVVGNSWLAILGRQRNLPDAEVILSHGMRVAIPAICLGQVMSNFVPSMFAY